MLAFTAAVTPATATTITDLGTLGGSYSFAYGINAAGQVVGESETTDNAAHAFLYSGGVMTDLGTLGAFSSHAYGINAAGQVVGESGIDNAAGHGFLYSGGVMTDLDPLGGSAYGINAAGQVVGGYNATGNGDVHAFLYSGGVMTDLGTLGGSYSYAYGINPAGQVVGQSQTTGNAGNVAFVYSGGVMSDLGTLGGSAYGINAAGQVVGQSHNVAFLYSGGVVTYLGLGGSSGAAEGINAAGQVVGQSQTTGNATSHAFLYSGGVVTDLNSLLPPGSGWVLDDATAINDSGQIAGYGTINGHAHAFLMSALCNFSSAPGQPERCFGGIGPRCEGVPIVAPFIEHEDSCLVDGWMSVGSILHDRCCLATNNAGWSSLIVNQGDRRHCRKEWREAWHNTQCTALAAPRQWQHTFGPYPDGNTGDNTSQDLRAPAGARVNRRHASLCVSGRCQTNAKGKPAMKIDLCGWYCECQ